ncbi:MAG: Fibronectin type III domain protein [Methanomassiliicoccales archaeon PtaU1.Bin030]|nr:MAG: Fibronectin type III domain protein [Methanomassiliicoccales archaeon PtaU1.Bin030]
MATSWELAAPQIAVDGQGYVHICYHMASGDLAYFTNNGGSWTGSTIVNDVHTSNGQIYVKGKDQVGIVYSDDTNGLLMSATSAGGAWSKQTIDEGASSFSLALTPGEHENVHLCYMGPNKMFKYATTKGDQWYSEPILGGGMASNYQIAAGPGEKAHVVYVDDVDGDLKYTTNAEGAWISHIIDQSGDVGNCEIAVGSSGEVHIGFNYPYGDLIYATNSDGSWTTHVVEHTEIGVLSSGPILIGPEGKVHIAYQRSPTNEIFYGSFTPQVITRPGPPQNVTVTPQQGYANISWSPPANNGSADILAYDLYRGTSPTSMTSLAIVEEMSFIDMSVVEGTTYYYQVSAFNREGEGGRSPIVNVTIMNTPSAPINLTLSNENDRIMLQWEAPADDGGSPVTGYQIFRGMNGTAMEYLTTVDNTSYVDTQVQEGVTYYYTVVATNDLGVGPTSEAVNGATVKPAPSQAEGILPVVGAVIAGAAALTGVILWRRGKAKG